MYSNHIITRNSIQIAELAFGGTGLCFYRVRGVDGSCAKHSTVECYTVIYAATNHTYYYYYYLFSVTHTFLHSRLKTFLFCKSFPYRSLSFSSSGLTTWISPTFTVTSEHTRFYFLVFFCFTLFNCRFRAVD